jgi:tRNA A-37 threonylcarbamoyl transferase component Bud32/tetratricopeptide (TPR) repeat protein
MSPLKPEHWDSAAALFERLVDAPAAERDLLLHQAAGNDPALETTVRRMLEHDAREGHLLDGGLETLAGGALQGDALMPGARVGDFEILSELARGGMGIVYRARDTLLGREAALKLLPLNATAPRDHAERLLAEARAASALDHPNIATVYQIGEAGDGRRFIAMALYDGETLRDRLARGRFSAREALDVVIQVARGLAAAHQAGIVHRDVKPANICLTRQGLVKLLDFGIAALAGSASEDPSIRGTVLYMSPQQVRGQAPSPRDDVWSLGVVLYEMVAGQAPFTGEDRAEVLERILQPGPSPSLRAAVRGVTRLDRVVSCALAKDAAARFPDGCALLRALERLARAPRSVLARVGLAGAIVAVGATALAAPLRRSPAFDLPVLAVGEIEAGAGGSRPELLQVLPGLLTERLAQVPPLHLVSRERLLEVRAQLTTGDRRPPFAEVARRAGATEVIEGMLIDLTDGRLRLEIRRVDPKTGGAKGAITAEGVEVFDVVDQAVGRLVRTLGVHPSSTEGSFPTRSLVAYRFYEEGLRAYYQGDALGAHRLFTAAFAEDTTFAMALYYDRRARFWAARLPVEADTMLPRLARLAEGRPERERLLIRALWADATGQPAGLALAESLATRYPTEPDGHYLMGRMKWRLAGDFLGSIPHFRRVFAMDSLSVHGGPVRCLACDALADMIAVYHLADSLSAAERIARQWVELQPDASRAWVHLATALEREQRFEEALAARARAAPLQPGNRTDPVYPAILDIFAGDFKAADALLRQRMGDSPPVVRREAGWFLVISLRAQGRLREALAAARAIPNRLAEATVLLELGRAREAAALFDSLAGLEVARPDPRDSAGPRRSPWLLTHKATALAAARDTGALMPVAEEIEAASRRFPNARNRRLAHYARGLALAARGEYQPAEAAYRRAIYSLTNGYNRINVGLARTLLALDRPGEAIQVLHPVLRGPVEVGNFYLSRTEIHALLGEAFEADRRRDSATVYYRRVLSAWRNADPEFRPRRDAIRLRLDRLRRDRLTAR